MRKARAFRGGANKTAPPCFPKAVSNNLANVPVEQLQRNITLQKILLLGKPPESGSARLGYIPSLPWEPQLPLKSCISLQPPDFEGNCDSLRFSPRFLFCFHCAVLLFAPQMWAARPHLANIFEKLLDQKTFYSPAARCLQPIQKNIF